MKNEKPILFTGDMVKAVLDGRKTQTRRVVKRGVRVEYAEPVIDDGTGAFYHLGDDEIKCPYGQPGDRLWVRETWQIAHIYVDPETGYGEDGEIYPGRIPAEHPGKPWDVVYAANMDDMTMCPEDRFIRRYRPSIHMPRWASRINLTVTDVRVERVQEISSRDAWAEGCRCKCLSPVPQCAGNAVAFQSIWDSINLKRGYGWDVNPWAWVVTFEKDDA